MNAFLADSATLSWPSPVLIISGPAMLDFLCWGHGPQSAHGASPGLCRGLFFAGYANEKFGGMSLRSIIPADHPLGARKGSRPRPAGLTHLV